ncbi:hypothetical protein LA080_008766 [Diaporthe eres]|nr:hypothetical protein LA080_008766 [Diaporthe eres]
MMPICRSWHSPARSRTRRVFFVLNKRLINTSPRELQSSEVSKQARAGDLTLRSNEIKIISKLAFGKGVPASRYRVLLYLLPSFQTSNTGETQSDSHAPPRHQHAISREYSRCALGNSNRLVATAAASATPRKSAGPDRRKAAPLLPPVINQHGQHQGAQYQQPRGPGKDIPTENQRH